ncbi:hypothetical protein RRG08_052355 [Elysia crispata]|uniref:Uncharacterized protein n=1 Tax=Elysia crispata TaxID=231223 RepID=A0AAE1A6C1_9GAST|nr:hypothetical protein RRG08_052355 [Elysia crispata]
MSSSRQAWLPGRKLGHAITAVQGRTCFSWPSMMGFRDEYPLLTRRLVELLHVTLLVATRNFCQINTKNGEKNRMEKSEFTARNGVQYQN